jgi:hypothetical protein
VPAPKMPNVKVPSIVVDLHGSQFDPCPEKEPKCAFTALDMKNLIDKLPQDKLHKIIIEADSGGEMGYMCPVSKHEIYLQFRENGTAAIKLRGDEFCEYDHHQHAKES